MDFYLNMLKISFHIDLLERNFSFKQFRKHATLTQLGMLQKINNKDLIKKKIIIIHS